MRARHQKSEIRNQKSSWLAVCGLLLFLLAGCNRSGPETVAVEGKITYGGGPWPTPGVLMFGPLKVAPGMPSRPALVNFNVNGNFRVSSFRENDGLIPGQYAVGVECYKELPPPGSKTPPESCVPAKYRDSRTSGLEVTVKPGGPKVTIQWDVPKP